MGGEIDHRALAECKEPDQDQPDKDNGTDNPPEARMKRGPVVFKHGWLRVHRFLKGPVHEAVQAFQLKKRHWRTWGEIEAMPHDAMAWCRSIRVSGIAELPPYDLPA